MELTSLVKRHPLAAFCGGSVVVGSAVTLLSAQLPANSPLRPLAAIPVSFVPAACALTVLRMAGSDEDRLALRRRLTTIRVGWRWYVVALAALPAAHLAGVALATLPRGAVVSHPAALALLPLFLVTSLGEEIGWRGYALPKLQERFSPLAAALILGVVWSAFHWAALLSNSEAPLAYVVVSTFQLTAMSVIMAVVFNNTREAVPVLVLMHAVYNTVSVGVLPLAETGDPILAFSLSAAATWLVAIGLVIAAGWGRDADRRERATTTTPLRG